MTWAKFDVSLPRHQKMLVAESIAGDSAWTLHSKGILYCREHSTDGTIKPVVLPTMTKHPDPTSVAEALVTAGLWKKTKAGYVIHDYLEWNPSKEQIDEEKARARDRMKRNRSPEQGDAFGNVRANKRRTSEGVRQTEKSREEKSREEAPLPPADGSAEPAGVQPAAPAAPGQAPEPSPPSGVRSAAVSEVPQRAGLPAPNGSAEPFLAVLRSHPELAGVANPRVAERVEQESRGKFKIEDFAQGCADIVAKMRTDADIGEFWDGTRINRSLVPFARTAFDDRISGKAKARAGQAVPVTISAPAIHPDVFASKPVTTPEQEAQYRENARNAPKHLPVGSGPVPRPGRSAGGSP